MLGARKPGIYYSCFKNCSFVGGYSFFKQLLHYKMRQWKVFKNILFLWLHLKNPFILLFTFWKRPWGHTLYPKGKKTKANWKSMRHKGKVFFQLQHKSVQIGFASRFCINSSINKIVHYMISLSFFVYSAV